MALSQSDFIARMHGPDFVVFYSLVTLGIIIASGLIVRWSDATRGLPLPDVPQEPDPFDIAQLRGGTPEVVRMTIASLVHRGYLTIEKKSVWGVGSGHKLAAADLPPNPRDLNPIERAVFDFALTHDQPHQFFQEPFASRVSNLLIESDERNKERGFLSSPLTSSSHWLIMLSGMGMILMIGGYKLLVAMQHGKRNVGFLILIGLAGTVIHVLVCRPKRITHLGKRYLAQLKDAYSGLSRAVIHADATGSEDILPFMLAMGIFGMPALTGTQLSGVRDMFQSTAHAGSTFNGGCGGSGCGSSCGGGGCGGGGCGGCGGS